MDKKFTLNIDDSIIIYEIPTTARIRSFLRYEYISKRLESLSQDGNPLYTLQVLHDLINFTRFHDIKSELLQHLHWQENNLREFSDYKITNKQEIDKLVAQKTKLVQALDAFKLPIRDYLNNYFLNAVKLRLSITGGTSHFDLPLLHTWLNQPDTIIRKDLQEWIRPFDILNKSISNCLTLTRLSGNLEMKTAENGYYIQNFDLNKRSPTMIHIELDKEKMICPIVYPEIITSKRHFTIHFFEVQQLKTRSSLIKSDIDFKIICCNL